MGGVGRNIFLVTPLVNKLGREERGRKRRGKISNKETGNGEMIQAVKAAVKNFMFLSGHSREF